MTKFRRSASGVTRIVRDDYRKKTVPKILQGTQETWWSISKKVRARDQGRCVRCSAPENPSDGTYHDVHHIIELSRGGRTTMSNLILLCKSCHGRRHPSNKHMR